MAVVECGEGERQVEVIIDVHCCGLEAVYSGAGRYCVTAVLYYLGNFLLYSTR